MRTRFTPLVLLLALVSFHAHAGYQTYVQTNENHETNKIFVLVLVKNVPLVKSKPDISSADVTLSNNEARTVIKGNKYFPDRRYTFDISFEKPIVTVTIDITNKGKKLFHSVQQYASW